MTVPQRIAAYAVAAAGIIPFLYLPFVYERFSTPRVLAWAVVVLVLAGVTVHNLITSAAAERAQFVRIATHPIILTYAAFIGWLTVRAMPVWSPLAWWGTWLRMDGLWFEWSLLVFAIAAAWWHHKGSPGISYAGYTLIVVGLASTVVSKFVPVGDVFGQLARGRLNGFAGNPLYLAQAFVFIPWFAVYLTRGTQRAAVRWGLWAASAAVFVLITYFTGLRGAALAIIAAAAVLFFESRRNPRILKLVGALVILGALVAGGLWVSRHITQADPVVRTFAIREVLWRTALQNAASHPVIGFGFGEHLKITERAITPIAYVLYEAQVFDSTHNEFLDMALQGGAVAVILFAVWVIVAYRRADAEDRVMQIAARATLVAYLTIGATAFFTTWSLPLLLLMFVPAIAHATELRVPVRFAWVGIGAMSVVVCASAVWILVTVPAEANALHRAERAVITHNVVEFSRIVTARSSLVVFAPDRDVQLIRWGVSLIKIARNAAATEQQLARAIVPVIKEGAAREYLPPAQKYAFAMASSAFTVIPTSLTAADLLQLSERLHRATLQDSPDRPPTVFQLADTLREQGKKDEALALLDAYRMKYPDMPEAYMHYAFMAYILGKYDIAADAAARALELHASARWGELRNSWKGERQEALEFIKLQGAK